MILLPITQADLEDRHPGLASELWTSYPAEVSGTAAVFAYVSGNDWTLTDASKTFTSGYVDRYGVARGLWGFKVKSYDSATQLTITLNEYPDESTLDDTAIDTTYATGVYSIGGYSRQIIIAAEDIVRGYTNAGLYPEAFDWTERARGQFEAMFVYKTLDIIMRDFALATSDIWEARRKFYDALYREEFDRVRVLYDKDAEPDTDENWTEPNWLRTTR